MMLRLDTIGHTASFNKKKADRVVLNEPPGAREKLPF
jgi:hypothetical protein